jgi:hypothetical protein
MPKNTASDKTGFQNPENNLSHHFLKGFTTK